MNCKTCKNYKSIYCEDCYLWDYINGEEYTYYEEKEESCKNCGSKQFYNKPVKMHLGLYCKDCNKWQRWVKK